MSTKFDILDTYGLAYVSVPLDFKPRVLMGAPALVEVPADPFAVVRAWRRMVSAGFSLSVEGDMMVVIPASNLSDSQRTYIRTHKTALVALLSDAETLTDALALYGPAGLGWREGTPGDWPDTRLLAAG